jgi:hypothetical protein
VQPRKTKPEPNIAEAAEKTGLLIRGLQSRLLEGAKDAEEPSEESTATLEKQLEQYFAGWPGEESRPNSPLNRIRDRVIDGVVERIMRAWQQQDQKTHPFENEVIERLIDGVLKMLGSNSTGGGSAGRAKPAATQLPGNKLTA